MIGSQICPILDTPRFPTVPVSPRAKPRLFFVGVKSRGLHVPGTNLINTFSGFLSKLTIPSNRKKTSSHFRNTDRIGINHPRTEAGRGYRAVSPGGTERILREYFVFFNGNPQLAFGPVDVIISLVLRQG